jgi:pilus assembly protein Flp/PilA
MKQGGRKDGPSGIGNYTAQPSFSAGPPWSFLRIPRRFVKQLVATSKNSGKASQACSRSHMRLLRDFWRCESGATAIEYGLIAAGIALSLIAVVNGLGTKLKAGFTSINTQLK